MSTRRIPLLKPLPPSLDPLLTASEVARALRCSKRTVQRLVSRGILPAPLRLSPQKPLWRTSTIRAFVEARAALAQANAPEKVPLVIPTGRRYAAAP